MINTQACKTYMFHTLFKACLDCLVVATLSWNLTNRVHINTNTNLTLKDLKRIQRTEAELRIKCIWLGSNHVYRMATEWHPTWNLHDSNDWSPIEPAVEWFLIVLTRANHLVITIQNSGVTSKPERLKWNASSFWKTHNRIIEMIILKVEGYTADEWFSSQVLNFLPGFPYIRIPSNTIIIWCRALTKTNTQCNFYKTYKSLTHRSKWSPTESGFKMGLCDVGKTSSLYSSLVLSASEDPPLSDMYCSSRTTGSSLHGGFSS